MTADRAIATVLFVLAAGSLVLAGRALIRHEAPGNPPGAPAIRYVTYAIAGVLWAVGLTIEADAELRNNSDLGLIGSLLVLAAIALPPASRRVWH